MNITIDLKIILLSILGLMTLAGVALLVAYGIMSHDDTTVTTLNRAKTIEDCLLAGAIMFPTGFVGSIVVLKNN